MSQKRYLDFHAPRTAQNFNEKMRRATPAVLSEAMAVSKGTDDFDVTLGAGAWISHEGIAIVEDAAQDDLLTLADPDASDRIDVIYGSMLYEADTEPTPAAYAILKGTPGDVPVKPTPAAGQIEIASIYVPSDASTLDDCFVREANPLKAWLAAVIGSTIDCSLFCRVVGDPFLTTGNPTLKLIYEYGIEDGDAWIDRDGHDLYLYDADANEWVSSDVLSHASTHHCAGSDPIDVKDICDTQGYRHLGTKAAHDALGLSHSFLSGVSANQHHNRDHKATHSAGGADPLDVKDLADVLAYLHKHLTALSECPHGDDDHIENYAKNPHTHASHGGVLSRGQIGFGADVGCELPVGIGAWSDYIAEMEIADTTLYITALHVACDTTATPSASVSFVFSLNGTEIGTVTLTEGNSHAALNIEDVALSDADRVKIAWPADRKGATGFCAYAVIERRGVEEE